MRTDPRDECGPDLPSRPGPRRPHPRAGPVVGHVGRRGRSHPRCRRRGPGLPPVPIGVGSRTAANFRLAWSRSPSRNNLPIHANPDPHPGSARTLDPALEVRCLPLLTPSITIQTYDLFGVSPLVPTRLSPSGSPSEISRLVPRGGTRKAFPPGMIAPTRPSGRADPGQHPGEPAQGHEINPRRPGSRGRLRPRRIASRFARLGPSGRPEVRHALPRAAGPSGSRSSDWPSPFVPPIPGPSPRVRWLGAGGVAGVLPPGNLRLINTRRA